MFCLSHRRCDVSSGCFCLALDALLVEPRSARRTGLTSSSGDVAAPDRLPAPVGSARWSVWPIREVERRCIDAYVRASDADRGWLFPQDRPGRRQGAGVCDPGPVQPVIRPPFPEVTGQGWGTERS